MGAHGRGERGHAVGARVEAGGSQLRQRGGGLAAEAGLLLAIVYSEPGNRLFGTAPLPADAWLFGLPFALLLGVAEEARKGVLRWAGRRCAGK